MFMKEKKEFYLDTEYRALVNEYLKPAEEALIEFLKINSIFDEETVSKEHPFGSGVENALKFLAELGEKLGFEVDRCDNYVTELSYGRGELLDIYAHADVVPVSKNWDTDPFDPVIKDGKIFARGATDDKSPGIAALFAAKAMIDSGRIEGYKLRVIFGGNEERGSRCLEHYFHEMKKEYPTYGFTPDADFPLIYAEKGIYGIKLFFPLKEADGELPRFSFGEASNVVLDNCRIEIEETSEMLAALDAYRKAYKGITITNNKGKLHFIGKAVHGSTPWDGVNAGLHMLNFIGTLYNIPRLSEIYRWFCVGDGKACGCDYSSAYFDRASYCVGIMSYDGKHLILTVNMRLPENVTKVQAIQQICARTGAMVEDLGGSDALIIPPTAPLIKTLMKVYQQETGDLKAQPMAIGGGTYARESKNSVAFGPTFTGRDYHIHQDNEFIYLDDFYNLIGIYAHAIDAVGELIKKKD